MRINNVARTKCSVVNSVGHFAFLATSYSSRARPNAACF
jgi:hypothetical protein